MSVLKHQHACKRTLTLENLLKVPGRYTPNYHRILQNKQDEHHLLGFFRANMLSEMHD